MATEKQIDFEQLKRRLREDDEISWVLYDRIKLHINAVATDVVHGRWIDGMKCSVCGQVDWTKPNYCPNCGADMRGEEDA